MSAPRPEPAPAMGYFSHVSFGDSVWALADDEEMDELPSTVKLAYASADSAFTSSGATMSDVARVLYDCRPALPAPVLAIRERAMMASGSSKGDANDDTGATIAQLQRHMEHRPAPRVQNPDYKQRRLPVRHLRVNDSGIKALELEDIAALLCGHATLTSLALQSNEFLPRPGGLMARLGCAISLSNLRILELSNNAIGPRSMCEFLTHLNAPTLSHLYLSMTMQEGLLHADQQMNALWQQGDQAWKDTQQDGASQRRLWSKEMERVTDLLIALVRPQGKPHGAQHGRNAISNPKAPHVPLLECLSLNGNDLRWRNVRRLVAAILQYNTNLTHVELFATCSEDDSDDDEDEEERREEGDSGRRGSLRRVTSIGSAMLEQQRDHARAHEQRLLPNEGSGRGGALTPPRAARRPQATASPPVASSSPLGIVQRNNWRRVLGSHLWHSRLSNLEAKTAARHLLSPARILSCKCREAPSNTRPAATPSDAAPFPFTHLPAEIRRRVFMHMDDGNALTTQQIERIISFASDSSTIGFGSTSAHLGLGDEARHAIMREAAAVQSDSRSRSRDEADDEKGKGVAVGVADYGLLPHHRWRWADMIAYHSVPRDWPAQVIDNRGRDSDTESAAFCERSDDELVPTPISVVARGMHGPSAAVASSSRNEHEGLGGGGPDGDGGAARRGQARVLSRSWRTWLEEQAALQAFWEASGTFSAEVKRDGAGTMRSAR